MLASPFVLRYEGFMKSNLLAAAAALSAICAAPLSAQSVGVFVEQIGDGNSATLNQATNQQRAEVRQDGIDNIAEVDQQGDGAHVATVGQTGNDNNADITQQGDVRSVAILAQNGNGNTANLFQNDTGTIGSIASITQNGSGNNASLVQDGSDNQALLAQNGDNNAMTAVQVGEFNRLEWAQNGSGLTDIMIVQTGGAAAVVTQGQ